MDFTHFYPWYMIILEYIIWFWSIVRVFSGSCTFWKTSVILKEPFELQNCTDVSDF